MPFEIANLRRKRLGCQTRTGALRVCLKVDVEIANRIGAFGCKIGVLRRKSISQTAIQDLVHGQAIIISLEDAVLDRFVGRCASQPEHDQNACERANAVGRWVEFGQPLQSELFDRIACEVARSDKLNLARHRLSVGRSIGGLRRAVRAGK